MLRSVDHVRPNRVGEEMENVRQFESGHSARADRLSGQQVKCG